MDLKTNKIPKIIIQTWKSKDLPEKATTLVNKLLLNNPEFEYKFFTDEDINIFMKTYYSNYLDKFNSFKHTIQKIDFFRYLVIYHFGGFYFDIDMDIVCNLKPLCDYSCVFPKELGPHGESFLHKQKKDLLIGNYAFGASPKNEFLKLCIDNIINNRLSQYITHDMKFSKTIFYSTGPVMVTQSYFDYKDKNLITIIESTPFKICQFGDYGSHLCHGTWKNK